MSLPPCLDISPREWKLEGPEEYPEARLRCCVLVECNGPDLASSAMCHLEAIEVVEQSAGGITLQVAAHDDLQSTLDSMPEGRFDTIELLPGRKYVLLMVPFSA